MILLVAGRVQRIFNLGVDENMQKKAGKKHGRTAHVGIHGQDAEVTPNLI